MVADLPLHSLLSKDEADGSQINTDSAEGSWTWNPNSVQDDDSWEVKAFAEDTSSIMGSTWPPRSYTCTFCRREFRSAQALGGHMNVHRKDRARLNQSQFLNPFHNLMSASSSSHTVPTNQEIAPGSGLCVLYQLPHANGIFAPIRMSAPCLDPSSSSSSQTFVLVPPNASSPVPHPPDTNLQRQPYPWDTVDLSPQRSSHGVVAHKGKGGDRVDFKEEEIDLELRLGK
ncbi:hypothetical protein MLD38_010637 [Melastoma candidum]|uniref:Uncharacterized protein n=1 Tax=Melastoma candidum TaxID=119954 RepID=A0ACB9R0I3_9MYRT|nr:hypothetical protein MLD38_010637 [Melastoma candidum]